MGLLSSLLPPVLTPGQISMTVGTVTLQYLEIPEKIGPLGTHLDMEAHDFPGGTRTVQTFGSFPEPFSWKGILTGATAFSRSLELQRLAAVGPSITFFYGTFAYMGYVSHYHAAPSHQWHIPYEMEFFPQQDLSGSIVSLLAAAGLGPEIALANQMGLLTTLNSATGGALTTPIGMQSPVSALLATTSSALLGAGGKVAAISPTNAGLISAGVGAVVSAAGPYVSSLPSAAKAFGG